MEQAGDLGQVTKAGQELVSTIRNLALTNDIDRLQESSDRFHEYIEHILEVSKLIIIIIIILPSVDNEKKNKNVFMTFRSANY